MSGPESFALLGALIRVVFQADGTGVRWIVDRVVAQTAGVGLVSVPVGRHYRIALWLWSGDAALIMGRWRQVGDSVSTRLHPSSGEAVVGKTVYRCRLVGVEAAACSEAL